MTDKTSKPFYCEYPSCDDIATWEVRDTLTKKWTKLCDLHRLTLQYQLEHLKKPDALYPSRFGGAMPIFYASDGRPAK